MSLPFAASASAGTCAHAHATPKKVSTKDAQHAVLCLLNKERKDHGLKALRASHKLRKSSRDHTAYMGRHDCFDHECPGEASLDGRLHKVHYLKPGLSRWLYGENIAYGTGKWSTPKEMVKAWMNSAGHRANILDPDFRDLGVGVIWGTPGNPNAHGGMYTTDFGYRRK